MRGERPPGVLQGVEAAGESSPAPQCLPPLTPELSAQCLPLGGATIPPAMGDWHPVSAPNMAANRYSHRPIGPTKCMDWWDLSVPLN